MDETTIILSPNWISMMIFISTKANIILFKVLSLKFIQNMFVTNWACNSENVAVNVKGFIRSNNIINKDWNHSAQQKLCQITSSLQPDL